MDQPSWNAALTQEETGNVYTEISEFDPGDVEDEQTGVDASISMSHRSQEITH